MVKNIGQMDKIVRVVLALLIVILILTGQITGLLAVFLGILAAALVLTSLIGTCPFYLPFKFSTKKRVSN